MRYQPGYPTICGLHIAQYLGTIQPISEELAHSHRREDFRRSWIAICMERLGYHRCEFTSCVVTRTLIRAGSVTTGWTVSARLRAYTDNCDISAPRGSIPFILCLTLLSHFARQSPLGRIQPWDYVSSTTLSPLYTDQE
jgi:hypothetical protein